MTDTWYELFKGGCSVVSEFFNEHRQPLRKDGEYVRDLMSTIKTQDLKDQLAMSIERLLAKPEAIKLMKPGLIMRTSNAKAPFQQGPFFSQPSPTPENPQIVLYTIEFDEGNSHYVFDFLRIQKTITALGKLIKKIELSDDVSRFFFNAIASSVRQYIIENPTCIRDPSDKGQITVNTVVSQIASPYVGERGSQMRNLAKNVANLPFVQGFVRDNVGVGAQNQIIHVIENVNITNIAGLRTGLSQALLTGDPTHIVTGVKEIIRDTTESMGSCDTTIDSSLQD